jgi:hypothetical protein
MSDRKSIKHLLFEGWHIQIFKNDLDSVTAIGIKDGKQVVIDVMSGELIPAISVLADKIDKYEAGDEKMAEPYVNHHDELVEALRAEHKRSEALQKLITYYCKGQDQCGDGCQIQNPKYDCKKRCAFSGIPLKATKAKTLLDKIKDAE